MIGFACPSCGRALEAAEDQAGKKRECPHCGGAVHVPPPSPTVANPPPAHDPDFPGTAADAGVPPAPGDPDATAALPPGEPVTGAGQGGEATLRAPPWLPGLSVPGYEVLGELGRGGMGVVYRARQLRPRRLVALKVVLAGAHAGPDALARFRAEADAAARLQHPNIVQVHEAGEHAGRPYLALELVEGGSLAHRLAGGRPAPGEAAALVERLARAVQYAHERGVVHRDLKPSNVLLAESPDGDGWVPKVADFGTAKQVEGMVSVAAGPRTQTGAILGTPGYMAPEQAAGKNRQVGPAADVYALGAILYEMLTGRPPFHAGTVLDTLLKVATEDPVPPRRAEPSCPRDLEVVCLKCLRKEPGKRYATAGELADDLRRWLDGEPIRARPAGRAERLRRWVRRHRELAYLAGGALAAALVSLLVLALWPSRKGGPGSGERELPADLDVVPRDAFAFVTVRVADLLAREGSDALGPLLAGPAGVGAADLNALLNKVEQETGIRPRDVERATVVLLSDRGVLGDFAPAGGGQDFDAPTVVLALARPYDSEEVLPRGGPYERQEHRGRVVYVPARGEGKASFCLLADRVLLIGRAREVRSLLDRAAAGANAGPLRAALARAAEGHALVAGVHPRRNLARLLRRALAPKEHESLAEFVSATLVLDLPPGDPPLGLDAEVRLDFPDEGRADKGLSAAGALLREALKDPAGPAGVGGPATSRFVGRLLAPLREAEWRQEGRALRLTAALRWDRQMLEDLRAEAREAAARLQSLNNIRQIALAFHTYHNAHRRLPPAAVRGKDGRPLYSWRVELLPYLGRKDLYDQFRRDEPWDGEHNKRLLGQMPSFYAAPGHAPAKPGGAGTTFYQAFVGPGAAFEGRQGLSFADFRDGTSITILVVEAARAVPWTKPEDLEYAPGRPPPAVGGIFKGGFHAAMADGSARFFPATIDAGTLRALVTRNGGEQVDFTTLRVLRRAGERQPPPPPPPPRPRPPGR